MTVTVTFLSNFDPASVDAVLWPLKTADTTFLLQIRPFKGARSIANPEYQMTSRLFNYSPFGGALGAASQGDVQFKNASQSGLTKWTT